MRPMVVSYDVHLTVWGMTFCVIRNNLDGSPFNDGGVTPCRSFWYQETFGL